MANLASTAVVINRAWTEGGVTGKDRMRRSLNITLTGQGGATNKILASVLGFTKIEGCSNAVGATGQIYAAVPSYDGTYIQLCVGTSTAVLAVADVTGETINIEVAGY